MSEGEDGGRNQHEEDDLSSKVHSKDVLIY